MDKSEINAAYKQIQTPKIIPSMPKGKSLISAENGQLYYFEGEYTKENQAGTLAIGNIAAYRVLAGTNSNRFKQLQSILGPLPNGPWHIDGRDDKVSVHNYRFGQTPIATYTYAGGNGELLSVEISTKKKFKTVQTTQSSTIDPDTKEVSSNFTQSFSDPDSKSFEATGSSFNLEKILSGEKPEDPQITAHKIRLDKIKQAKTEQNWNDDLRHNYIPTEEECNKYVNDVREQFNKALDAAKKGDVKDVLGNYMGNMKIKVKRPVRTKIQPLNYGGGYRDGETSGELNKNNTVKQYDYSDIAGRYRTGYSNISKDPSIIILDTPNNEKARKDWRQQLPLDVIMDKEIEVEVDGARALSMAQPQDISNLFSVNDLKDFIQKQVILNFSVLGRPEIESSMALQFNNISNKFSGKWYTLKVRHTIDQGGYKVTGECIRDGYQGNISTATGSFGASKLAAQLTKIGKENIGKHAPEVLNKIRNEYRKEARLDPKFRYESTVVNMDKPIPADGNVEYEIRKAKEDMVNIDTERIIERERQKKFNPNQKK